MDRPPPDGSAAPPIGTARQAIMAAAIETITELGYYRASSNAIARRANVTWGVIQHHFGSREGLLLAALEHSSAVRDEAVGRTVIEGATLTERLASYGRALDRFYGSESFLTHLQIVVDLLKDPATKDATRASLVRTTESSTANMIRLLEDVLGDEVSDDHRHVVFAAMRGVALDDLVYRSLHPGRPRRDPSVVTDVLAALLAPYLAPKPNRRRRPRATPERPAGDVRG